MFFFHLGEDGIRQNIICPKKIIHARLLQPYIERYGASLLEPPIALSVRDKVFYLINFSIKFNELLVTLSVDR